MLRPCNLADNQHERREQHRGHVRGKPRRLSGRPRTTGGPAHGRTALLHQGKVVAIYNDTGDAYQIGCDKYGLGHFTIQVIGARPIHLGVHAPGMFS